MLALTTLNVPSSRNLTFTSSGMPLLSSFIASMTWTRWKKLILLSSEHMSPSLGTPCNCLKLSFFETNAQIKVFCWIKITNAWEMQQYSVNNSTHLQIPCTTKCHITKFSIFFLKYSLSSIIVCFVSMKFNSRTNAYTPRSCNTCLHNSTNKLSHNTTSRSNTKQWTLSEEG
jgi:hypothetical protein